MSGKCGKIANRLQLPPQNQLQGVIVRIGERLDALESEYARNKKLAGVGARCVNLPSLPGNQSQIREFIGPLSVGKFSAYKLESPSRHE